MLTHYLGKLEVQICCASKSVPFKIEYQSFYCPLITAALRSRCGHYIFALWFLLSFFFSSPNLSSGRVDVYRTSTHGVALVRIENADLKCAVRDSLEIQDAKMTQKLPSVGLFLRNWGVYRQSETNLLNSNISPTCAHNMVNFGPLTADICSGVWGTPANFNWFRVLEALLHGRHSSSGRQPNFAALNRG